jgi:hypothetical protein
MDTKMIPLMLVPLIVWISVWGYLWAMDNKIKMLERQMTLRHDDEDAGL